MSHVVVTNSFAKTVKIPTTPVKYLTEVRDEACQKFGLSKDQFTLKYNNKSISLSQQIRLANLPQGARLELVQASRSPTVVSVALQLPKSRLTQKFANNTSLWEILRYFESGDGANYNFTQRAIPEMSGASGSGRLCYEMPVITVMPGHKEQSSFVGLQQTLSQLGFDSGSALLKLSFKNTGTPLEEAMTQISQYFKTEEPAPSGAQGAHAATSAQTGSASSLDTSVPEATTAVAGDTIRNNEPDPEPMDIQTQPVAQLAAQSEPEPVVSEQNNASVDPINTSPVAALATATSTAASEPPHPPAVTLSEPIEPTPSPGQLRNVQIFSASSSSTPQAARNAFNESDYQPTIEHAKIHQNQLSNRTRNQRLLSDKELEEQEKERQAKIAAATNKPHSLRIRLPDGSLVQMNITKADTATILYDFVVSLLEKKNEPFELKYTGPTGRLVLIARDQKRLIQDLRFSTNELITFQWAGSASAEARASRKIMAQEWQAKAQTLKIEEPAREEPQAEKNNQGQVAAEGKRKAMSSEDKESKLKNILGKGLFKRK